MGKSQVLSRFIGKQSYEYVCAMFEILISLSISHVSCSRACEQVASDLCLGGGYPFRTLELLRFPSIKNFIMI